MNNNSRIYVAGHRGLVGSSIIQHIRSKGYQNVFISAAKVGGILANNTYKADFIYDNIMIAANVIHSAYKSGVTKLLNLGSSCIYPKYAPQPMKEDYLLTDLLEQTNEPYAIAKISAIKLCRYFNEQHGTIFLSVMPTNLYGPNDNFNFETAHILPALLRKFHLAKLLKSRDFESIANDFEKNPLGFGLEKETPLNKSETSIINVMNRIGINKDYITLWGAGEAFREFLYVDDLADACVFIMEKYGYEDIGEFINIGTGEEIRIKDLARKINDIVGFDGAIKHDLSKPDGTPRKLLDISRIKSFGWQPATRLETGIKKTYDWYRQSMNKD